MISWVSIGESIYGARFAAPQNGLSSNMMALITSDCGAMRLPEHQMALIASGCVRQVRRRELSDAAHEGRAALDGQQRPEHQQLPVLPDHRSALIILKPIGRYCKAAVPLPLPLPPAPTLLPPLSSLPLSLSLLSPITTLSPPSYPSYLSIVQHGDGRVLARTARQLIAAPRLGPAPHLDGRHVVFGEVRSRGLQLQSLWRIPNAAVRLTRRGWSRSSGAPPCSRRSTLSAPRWGALASRSHLALGHCAVKEMIRPDASRPACHISLVAMRGQRDDPT